MRQSLKILRSIGVGDAANGVLLVLQEGAFLSRLDGPVVAFARVVLRALDLDKVLVKTEVVTNAVLPAALRQAVEDKVVRDPFVDLSECESAIL